MTDGTKVSRTGGAVSPGFPGRFLVGLIRRPHLSVPASGPVMIDRCFRGFPGETRTAIA